MRDRDIERSRDRQIESLYGREVGRSRDRETYRLSGRETKRSRIRTTEGSRDMRSKGRELVRPRGRGTEMCYGNICKDLDILTLMQPCGMQPFGILTGNRSVRTRKSVRRPKRPNLRTPNTWFVFSVFLV